MVQPRNNLGQFGGLGQRASLRAIDAAETSRLIAEEAAGTMTIGAGVFMREMVEGAAATVTDTVRQEITLFSQSLANKTRRLRDGRVTKVHQIAGQQAQVATLAAFKARHPSTGISRSVSRMANGAMVRAISDPNFITARYDGVGFANRSVLDSHAKQWYRLNFGAGPRGAATKRPGTYQIRFYGAVAGTVSMNKFQASKGFSIPTGVWIEKGSGALTRGLAGPIKRSQQSYGGGNAQRRGSGDEFLAYGPNGTDWHRQAGPTGLSIPKGGRFGKQDPAPTKGIRGSNYLDAGLQVLARSLGDGWTVLMREWFAEAANEGTGPVALAAMRENISGVDVKAMNVRLAESDQKIRAAFATFESSLR